MTEDWPDLESASRKTSRELLQLPLAALHALLDDAMGATRAAKRRENWLRALCVAKVRGNAAPKENCE